MNEETDNQKPEAERQFAPVSLLDDDELRKLLDAAERVKPKPTPPAAKDLVMEMYEVIGTLWEKGMTRKQMLAWLKKRGYTFKDYHLSLALRHYHDAKSSNDGTQRTGSPDVSLATETRKPGSAICYVAGTPKPARSAGGDAG